MTTIFLEKGNHTAESGKKCVNEFGAWLAGEPHTDMPHCYSVVYARVQMRLNDRLPDDLRQRLIPYAITGVGTNTGYADEITRAFMCADWGVHVGARHWFAAAGRPEWVTRVDALARVTDQDTARAAAKELRAIRDIASTIAIASAIASDSDIASTIAIASASDIAIDIAIASAQKLVRESQEALLPSALDLLDRMAAVGRKPLPLVADREAEFRAACHV